MVKIAGTALLVAIAIPSPATAATFFFSYDIGGTTVGGSFVTRNKRDGDGYSLITALSGTRGAAAMTLLPVGTAFDTVLTDNLINTDIPRFSNNGLGYAAGGQVYNPYFASGRFDVECAGPTCVGNYDPNVKNFKVVRAPTANFKFSYVIGGETVSGTFQTDNTVDANGYGVITALSGTRGAAAISLLPVGTAFDTVFTDNLINTDIPRFSNNGLGYAAGGHVYNPYFASGRFDVECAGPTCVGNYDPNVKNFTVTELLPQAAAVPEPSTWAMMIIGFGAIGSAVRRRHKLAGARIA